MDIFSTGDTAWVLICTILVLLMSIPAIAFFYGGLSKRKNVLNTMFLSFIAFAIVSVIWVIYGYSFAFGSDISGFIGAPANLLLQGIGIDSLSGSIPEILFIVFQLAFAGLTAALVSGGIVGRMKTKAWVLFIVLWITFAYIPIAHWVWGGGWLMQMGALDFAGGTVVHINSGITALAAAIVLGKRKDTSLLPHNLGYAVLGAGLLWFGWMGFNGGSDTYIVGKPTVLGAISGAVAGLVAITPAAGFVDVSGALVIGAVASLVSYAAIYYLKPKLGYDDALDVFGIHGMSGIWGAIATGIFATPLINEAAGLLYGNPEQLLIQILSVVVTLVYSFVVSYVIAKVLDKAMGGIRVEEHEEVTGLDTNLHEESAYNLH